MADENEEMLEKTMTSGEIMTLVKDGNGWFDVDQWDKDGNNRWHVHFRDYDKAKAEYDRWN